MRKFLILFMLLSALPIWACRPDYPDCRKPTIIIRMENFTFLQTMVDNYQEYLTIHMTRPDNASSCFNNGFASYYLGRTETDLKKGKKICESQKTTIISTVKGLIRTDSPEFKTVKSVVAREKLVEQGKKIEKQLELTFP